MKDNIMKDIELEKACVQEPNVNAELPPQQSSTSSRATGAVSSSNLFGGYLDQASENKDTKEEQSMNGQIRKAHRLIKSLQKRVEALESQVPKRV